jgi:hypothetical protein
MLSNGEAYGLERTKNICHQGTKTRSFILLFFPSRAEPLWGGALVSWCLGGEKKKVLPQNAQNLQQAPKKAEGLL